MGWKSALIWELDCLCNKLLCYSSAGATANINFLLSLLHGPCTSVEVNPSKLCSIINLSSQMKWVQLGREVQNWKKKKLWRAKAVWLCIAEWCSILPVTSRKQKLLGHSVRRACLAVTICSKLKFHLFVSTRCRILGVIWSYLCQFSLISFLPSTQRIFNVIIPAWALGNQKRPSRPW